MLADSFWSRVDELVAVRRPRLAFGLGHADTDVIQSLERAGQFAELMIVSPISVGQVSSHDTVVCDDPEKKISEMLFNNIVDGIVRGTIDDKRTLNAYLALSGERDTYCPTLMQDPLGQQYFVVPVSNSDGWTKEQRLDEGLAVAKFIMEWGISPKIAVYTSIRPDTYEANKDNNLAPYPDLCTTHDDALFLVQRLAMAGFFAQNRNIELNTSVEDGFNLHICVNGVVGNQVVRAVMACGGKFLTCTRIGLSRVYEDNSRTEKDFETHIRWAAALANKRAFAK